MWRTVPAPVAGQQPVPFRRILRPQGPDWLRAFLLSDEPVMIVCHWSPMGRTGPCVNQDCRGCYHGDPWPVKNVGFACARDPNGHAQFVLMLPEDAWTQLSLDVVTGEVWRGMLIRAKHVGPASNSRIIAKVDGRRPLGQADTPWDMRPDLIRFWREFLSRRWDGQFKVPGDAREG